MTTTAVPMRRSPWHELRVGLIAILDTLDTHLARPEGAVFWIGPPHCGSAGHESIHDRLTTLLELVAFAEVHFSVAPCPVCESRQRAMFNDEHFDAQPNEPSQRHCESCGAPHPHMSMDAEGHTTELCYACSSNLDEAGDERQCHKCGCTDARPCASAAGVGCYWFVPNLCSECAPSIWLGDFEAEGEVRAPTTPRPKDVIRPIEENTAIGEMALQHMRATRVNREKIHALGLEVQETRLDRARIRNQRDNFQTQRDDLQTECERLASEVDTTARDLVTARHDRDRLKEKNAELRTQVITAHQQRDEAIAKAQTREDVRTEQAAFLIAQVKRMEKERQEGGLFRDEVLAELKLAEAKGDGPA